MPYPAMQEMIDGVAPFSLRSYWKGRFLRDLPDTAIETFVAFAESRTSPHSPPVLEHSHGAPLVWRRMLRPSQLEQDLLIWF